MTKLEIDDLVERLEDVAHSTAMQVYCREDQREAVLLAAKVLEAAVDDLWDARQCRHCAYCPGDTADCEISDYECEGCPADCRCKVCMIGEEWEWRGIANGNE